ncbi:putative chloroperoxidase [Septoria linicola]|nr:putative chloroperoxidase [Septoria linicola]
MLSLTILFSLLELSLAFPADLQDLLSQDTSLAKRQLPILIPPFDANLQRVETTGKYKFVPPGKDDQRGPCPALNALANHNYLPHNGIATIPQFIEATGKGFGMSVDLSTLLAIYAAIMDGNLSQWSIGGADSLVGLLGGVLGQPQGLTGSHNKYEGDGSPTRGDLYTSGNSHLLQLKQFQELYDRGKAKDDYDLELLTDYRWDRFQNGIATNPYFFYGAFAGFTAQPAAWAFVYRMMGNKSAEYPKGKLNGSILKSFYSITGKDGEFKYTPGHERFPDNWYKRHPIDAYSSVYVQQDATYMTFKYPSLASVGGNTGKVNTYSGIDWGNLTGGVINSANLLEGNNAPCFLFQLAIQMLPDALEGLFDNISPALDLLAPVTSKLVDTLDCPQLDALNRNDIRAAFAKYPGYTKSYNGYKGSPKKSSAPAGGLLGKLLGG